MPVVTKPGNVISYRYIPQHGSLANVSITPEGKLSQFVRIGQNIDIADCHRWSYFLSNRMLIQSGLSRQRAVLTLWDWHEKGDFSSVKSPPPKCTGFDNDARLRALFKYTEDFLNCANHVAAMLYSMAIEKMIVVGSDEHRKDMKTENVLYSVFTENNGSLNMDPASSLNWRFVCKTNPIKQVEIYFTNFDDYPDVLADILRAGPSPVLINSMDLDVFTLGHAIFGDEESVIDQELLRKFGPTWDRAQQVKESDHTCIFTSTVESCGGFRMRYVSAQKAIQILETVVAAMK